MPESSVSSPAIYQLRVVLCGVSPLVWRRLLVVSTTSIASTRIWMTYSALGIQNSGRNHRRRSKTARRLDPRPSDALLERSKLNHIEVERLDAADLRQREPNIIGVGGLFVPETGIVDFKRVCEGMAGVVRKAGATIELGVTVTAISESDSAVKISAGGREWQATKLSCLRWIAIGPSGEDGGPQDGS